MNHLLLRLFVESIAPLIQGRKIGAVRLLSPVLSIELVGRADSQYLVVVLSTPGPFCFLDSIDPTDGMGKPVFRRIRGTPIAGGPDIPDDRVVRLGLSGTHEVTMLAVYLYGSAAKTRIETHKTIIESLDQRECGRTASKPAPPRRDALATVTVPELARHVETSEDGVPPVTGLTDELIECFSGPWGEIDLEGLLAFRDDLLTRSTEFVVGARGRSGAASPLPVTAAAEDRSRPLPTAFGPFVDARLACRTLGRFILTSSKTHIVDRHAAPLAKRLAKRKRLKAELELELADTESSATWRREANTLAAYQSRVPPGVSEVTLPDLYGSEDSITIELNPALPVRGQIERRFKRAAKLERGRLAIERRIQSIKAEIDSLDTDLSKIRNAPTLSEAVRLIDAAKRRHGITDRQEKVERTKPEPKRYRRFDLDSQWYVLVGRNDRENDELTFRVAAPEDVWLHAQQVLGSHVILKSSGAPGNPPGQILEAAAGIAAHFSKARHAGLVPVIYTLRKHVRKFKGSKPGQVLCEREKTIFAEPSLPPTGHES